MEILPRIHDPEFYINLLALDVKLATFCERFD